MFRTKNYSTDLLNSFELQVLLVLLVLVNSDNQVFSFKWLESSDESIFCIRRFSEQAVIESCFHKKAVLKETFFESSF